MKILFLLLLQAALIVSQVTLDTIWQRNQIDYVFPNDRARNIAIQRGRFNMSNIFPTDADWNFESIREGVLQETDTSRYFIATPKFTKDVPISLGYIKAPAQSKRITPYPDYSWHSSHGKNCDLITSATAIHVVEGCAARLLYVLDSGKIGDIELCPPQILVFNLKFDVFVFRYRFKSSEYTSKSLFRTLVRFQRLLESINSNSEFRLSM